MDTTASLTLESSPAVPPETRPRNRRRFTQRLALGLGIVLAIVGGATGWFVYAHSYQPWQPADMGMSAGHQIAGITDGIRETGLVVTAPSGQTGWFGYSLQLSGSHDVKVLGAVEFADPSEVSFKWQVLPGDIATSPAAATNRPVVVHPGEILTIWILATRPSDCDKDFTTSFKDIRLRWSALGFHHVYTAPIIAGADEPVPMYLCYPDSALKHLYDVP